MTIQNKQHLENLGSDPVLGRIEFKGVQTLRDLGEARSDAIENLSLEIKERQDVAELARQRRFLESHSTEQLWAKCSYVLIRACR